MSQPTARDYFDIAHGTFIWRTIPAFTRDVVKRVVKHPRGYLRDSGLLHALLRIPDVDALLSHPQMGASWEGMVVEEILRQLSALGVAHDYAYYRTGAGAEVDLVLEGAFGRVAVEIKHTSSGGRTRSARVARLRDRAQGAVGVVDQQRHRRQAVRRQADRRAVCVPVSTLTAHRQTCSTFAASEAGSTVRPLTTG